MDEVLRLIQRADEVLKAAPARTDPGVAYARAEELLAEARDRLPGEPDEDRRLELAGQIARRMADIDAATWDDAAGLDQGVARAPTSVDDPRRVPPNQHLTAGWPVLHVGSVPDARPEDWTLTVSGHVHERIRLSWDELQAMSVTRLTADMHCVTGWSRLDNTWEGVRVRDLVERAGARPSASHALVYGHPAYSANLDLDVLLRDDALFAWAHDGAPLPPAHGGPLRLVVPSRYAWKSVKWATELRLIDRDVRGYWEERGYHDVADPWREQRFRGD